MNEWTPTGRIRHYVETAIWPIPVAYLLVAGILGIAVPRVDRAIGAGVPVQFGVGAAQSLLAAFATGLITVIGFMISVVIAGLTFSGTTVSPRIVREMQRNTTIRHIFGLLLLSVVYAFLVLNRVAPPDDSNYVPDLAVWLVIPLMVIDVVALLVLVRQMGHALRLVEIIDSVYQRAERVIASMYRDELRGDDTRGGGGVALPSVTVRNEGPSGVVAAVDVRALVAEAVHADTTFELACAIGSYVPAGWPLLHVADGRARLDEARIQRAIVIADERTIDQDPVYGFRLLVDIATRALSPAVNDPTTAVQALDRIEALLALLAGRRLDRGDIQDDGGRVRLVVPLPDWDDFLSVSLTEIRQYGATSSQVLRRLRAILDDLLVSAPACRRSGLEHQLNLLDQTIASVYRLPTEGEFVRTADRFGLGEPAPRRQRRQVPGPVPAAAVGAPPPGGER